MKHLRENPQDNPTDWYDTHVRDLVGPYEAVDPAKLHAWLAGLLPAAPRSAADIGAGTGRDAAWLAAQGYDVVAVEPSSGMRSAGERLHPDPRIRWLDDRLPALATLSRIGVAFDLVMLNAVWRKRRSEALVEVGG